jgi:hypothetical protein
MDRQAFESKAREIAPRNAGDSVKAIAARFEPESGRLVVTYHLHDAPTDEDWDDCELFCAELEAAFPEIVATEASCLESPDVDADTVDLVYLQ